MNFILFIFKLFFQELTKILKWILVVLNANMNFIVFSFMCVIAYVWGIINNNSIYGIIYNIYMCVTPLYKIYSQYVV